MISIITTTYNRSELIKDLYKSLCLQKDKDFEWVIIDDGSTDDTMEKISQWEKENLIKIDYFYQNNQGKHIALNHAFDKIKTQFCINIDSDDCLDENAVYLLNKCIEQLDWTNIWAIVGPRVHTDGSLERKWKAKELNNIKFAQLYSKYDYKGETYILLNMEYIKDKRFPSFENEKLVPENYLYDLMDKDYWIKPISNTICISDYRNDGYTKNKTSTLVKSPCGAALANISSASNSYNGLFKCALAYSRYLSIIKVFNLNKDIGKDYKVSIICRFYTKLIYPLMYNKYKRKTLCEKTSN